MLLLGTNRKPYMGSPAASSHLPLDDIERPLRKVSHIQHFYISEISKSKAISYYWTLTCEFGHTNTFGHNPSGCKGSAVDKSYVATVSH